MCSGFVIHNWTLLTGNKAGGSGVHDPWMGTSIYKKIIKMSSFNCWFVQRWPKTNKSKESVHSIGILIRFKN